MCIIAAIPVGKEISKETLKRCWDNNPHGGGFMCGDGSKVVVFKEMQSFKRYWKEFTRARLIHRNSGFVCHFRISTHGKINVDNCHPFLVNKGLGFAHNGIIYSAPRSNDFSDTYMFNECILKKLPNGFLSNLSIATLIASYIGAGSKLAFLNSKGVISIINEKAGVWDKGVWYSNTGYQKSDYFDFGGKRMASLKCSDASCESQLEQMSIFDDEVDSKTYSTVKIDDSFCECCNDVLSTSWETINGCCKTCYNEILEWDILRGKGDTDLLTTNKH